jgi:hypothetical protein
MKFLKKISVSISAIWQYALYVLMPIPFADAQEEQNLLEFIESKQRSISSDICEDLVSLNDQTYCVKLTHITLNSCGKQSDWPCMDDEGCLEIKRLIKK